jgi:hypothetical protein
LAEWKLFLPLQSQTKRENKNKAKGATPELIQTERFTIPQSGKENISRTVREGATFFKEMSIEV